MSGQRSDNTVQASHFPPELMVFGLPADVSVLTQDSSQDKRSKNLKTVPPFYPSVQVHLLSASKQEAKQWVLKSGEWWGRAGGWRWSIADLVVFFQCISQL